MKAGGEANVIFIANTSTRIQLYLNQIVGEFGHQDSVTKFCRKRARGYMNMNSPA